MKTWPDDPFLQGYYEPLTTECSAPDRNSSDMCVFDARHIADGPLGRARVSHRVPACFHGTWKPAA